MRKELVISTFPQETRVAVIEDDELVEFLIERQRARSIAGNIYKGRVTKVLPGMQSAFVDIGLDRDAFLYVTDFLEDTDEYERLVTTAEDEAFGTAEPGRRPPRERSPRAERSERAPEARDRAKEPEAREAGRDQSTESDSRAAKKDRGDQEDKDKETDAPVTADAPKPERSGRVTSARRRDSRERKGRVPSFQPRREEAPGSEGAYRGLEVLPGETLAKYKGGASEVEAEAESDPQLEQVIDETEEQHILEKYPQEARMVIADQELPLDIADEGAEVGQAEAGNDDKGTASLDAGSDRATEEEPSGESESPKESRKESARGQDGAPEETQGDERPDTPASADAGSEEKPSRRVWIWERRDKQQFSRRTPGRRPRRRPTAKSDSARTTSSGTEPKISDLLREGQEILVQVSKEPIGKKGARITSHIALPGRYLVYMPTVDHVGVSRKIASEEERSRLKKIIAENRNGFPGGFIVRTAAEGRDEKEFVQDLRFLFDLWKEIREKSEKKSGPALIHSDLNLLEKVLRDQLSDEFKAIRLDNELEYASVLEFVSRFQPSLVNRVRLHLKDNPIFEEYGLQQEIDKAMRSKVWLRSGGYIVVNQTEALVAIDVNTGKFVGKSNRLEDTIVRTNMEAVHEIVRQVRLRNLGGIIVVDFIDMEERKSRQRVMQALEQELKKDRSPSKILQFNDFGLVAITRKRTQPSLEKVLGTTCPRCSGAGFVKAVEAVCYEIQQEVKKMLAHVEGGELTVRVNPEVAKALKKGDLVDFSELEEETQKDVRIQGDPTLDAERFDIF